MSDLIPFILTQEKEKVKTAVLSKPISIIFDGTSRVGEVFVIIVRFVDSEWHI